VACHSCGSAHQKHFESEVDIHFPRLSNANKRPVLVYPVLLVCLDCGRAEFSIPKEDLEPLRGE